MTDPEPKRRICAPDFAESLAALEVALLVREMLQEFSQTGRVSADRLIELGHDLWELELNMVQDTSLEDRVMGLREDLFLMSRDNLLPRWFYCVEFASEDDRIGTVIKTPPEEEAETAEKPQ